MTTVTGTDGKQYNITVTLNPATIAPASLTMSTSGQSATIKPATIKTAASVASITVSPVATTTSPPTTSSMAGQITNFNPVAMNRFDVDGVSYGVQNASQSWSLTEVDSQTLRFEIHQGDNFTGVDSSGVDRSELNSTQTYPANTPITQSYQLMIEPNAANGAFVNSATGWFIVGQWHNDDNSLGVGTSPPVAFNMHGDRLQVLARYVLPGGTPGNGPGNTTNNLTLWTDPNPIVTGVYHTISLQAKFSNDSTGYLKVWIDGVQVVNYSGPLGYGTGTEWEYGIYRNTAPDICAVNYRAVTIAG